MRKNRIDKKEQNRIEQIRKNRIEQIRKNKTAENRRLQREVRKALEVSHQICVAFPKKGKTPVADFSAFPIS